MKAGGLNEQIISFKNISRHESTTNAFLIAFALTSLANTYPVSDGVTVTGTWQWHSRELEAPVWDRMLQGKTPGLIRPFALRPALEFEGQGDWAIDSEIFIKIRTSGPELQKPRTQEIRALKIQEAWTQWRRTKNIFCYSLVEKKISVAQSPNSH